MRSLFFGIALFSLALGNSAGADSRLGNGGDYLAAEFVARATQIINILESSRRIHLTDDEIRGMRSGVLTMDVHSTDEKLIDRRSGHEVDAALIVEVTGEQKILLNRQRVMFAYDHKELFDRMVFHELLHIVGIYDGSYQRSSRQFPANSDFSPPSIEPRKPVVRGDKLLFICHPTDHDGDMYGDPLEVDLYENAIELHSPQFRRDRASLDFVEPGNGFKVFRGFKNIGGGDASTMVMFRAPLRDASHQALAILRIAGAVDGTDNYECVAGRRWR